VREKRGKYAYHSPDDHATLQSVSVATGAGANELLSDNLLVEVVELFALDASREVETMKELGRSQAHGVDVHALGSHFLDELDGGPLARLLVDLSLGANVVVGAVRLEKRRG
jgi:hypothetical protein